VNNAVFIERDALPKFLADSVKIPKLISVSTVTEKFKVNG